MTPDEALAWLSSQLAGTTAADRLAVLCAELERLRAIETAARVLLDESGSDLPHLDDALREALAVTPGLPTDPPRR